MTDLPAAIPAGARSAEVIAVVDGDTIEVVIGGRRQRIQLIGLKSPEPPRGSVPGDCHGTESVAYVTRLLQGRTVYLVRDASDPDQTNPPLRFVWYVGRTDGEAHLANEQLVRRGVAIAQINRANMAHADRFREAEQEARGVEVGVWATCGGVAEPTVLPTLVAVESTVPATWVATEPTPIPSTVVLLEPPPTELSSVPGQALPPGIAEADIDAYWRSMFIWIGVPYTTPSIVAFSPSLVTGCEGDAPASIASYCTGDETIYYRLDRYEEASASWGNNLWIHMMAHEWGHHVQWQLGLLTNYEHDTVASEVQATCLAGVYVMSAHARALLTSADFDQMWWMLGGDAEHGTREQNQEAFVRGYREGPSGCGITLWEEIPQQIPTAPVTENPPDVPADGQQDRVVRPGESVAEGSLVVITEPDINMRAGPTTEAPVLVVLATGTELIVSGPVQAGDDGLWWWPVLNLATGQTGYVAAQFLEGTT